MLLYRRYSDSWGYDPPVRKSELDEDENYGKPERKTKKYEDTVSENSVEDNKSVDSETIAEINKPTERVKETQATSPTKKTVKKENIKKIDLGAALHFGKDSNSSAQTSSLAQPSNTTKNSNQLLLDDIFNSGPETVNHSTKLTSNDTNSTNLLYNNNNNINLKSNSEDFADFSAFQSPTTGTESSAEDDFADFATALPTQPAQSSQNILSDVFSQPSNPFVGGVASPMSPLSPMQPLPATLGSPLGDSLGDILTPMPTSMTGSTSSPSLDLFGNPGLKADSANSGVFQNNTWSDLSKNVNISVDNLMGSKYERQTAPSMNQLANKVNNLSIGPTAVPPNSLGAGLSPVSPQQPFAQQIPFGND